MTDSLPGWLPMLAGWLGGWLAPAWLAAQLIVLAGWPAGWLPGWLAAPGKPSQPAQLATNLLILELF